MTEQAGEVSQPEGAKQGGEDKAKDNCESGKERELEKVKRPVKQRLQERLVGRVGLLCRQRVGYHIRRRDLFDLTLA